MKSLNTLSLAALISRSALLVSLLSGLSIAAVAQGDGGPSFSQEELKALEALPAIPRRQARSPGEFAFAVFSFGKSSEEYFYLRNKLPEMIIFNTGVIRRFQYADTPDGVLVFYKKTTNSAGEQKLRAVGRMILPSGSRDGIVLFMPDVPDEGEKEARTMPYVDLASGAFRPSDIRLVNMTTQPLMVLLDEKPVNVAPMADVVRKHNPSSKIFPVKVGVQTSGKLQMLYSNVFQFEPQNRVLFLIVPDWNKTNSGAPVRCMIYKDNGVISG
ncbi:MAG: hypothetical protein QE267_07520 [Akkermansiaceae bacterium]|nr:hypothetical protein [Akkermansiaceae bacterium]